MKRTLLDITQKLFRKQGNTILTPKDLNDSTYFIFEAIGWKFVDILREIEFRSSQDRISVYINTQSINPKDYVVEQSGNGLLVKFRKSDFEYELENDDYIEIKGDIEQYA
jgi:hypothetical protein